MVESADPEVSSSQPEETSPSLRKADLAKEAVRLRYERGMAAKDVKEELKLTYASEVSRLIDFARQNKLFHIEYSDLPPEGTRNGTLEEEIMSCFKVPDVIVVDCEYNPEASDLAMIRAEDDRVHQVLGKELAKKLMKLLAVTKPPLVSVGGGRGAFYTARSMEEMVVRMDYQDMLNLVDSKILSISGRMNTPVWDTSGREKHLSLDADDVASLLAGALNVRQENIFRLNLPLVMGGDETPEKHLAGHDHFLAPKVWDKNTPEVGLVGIGALDGGHRLNRVDSDFQLTPIQEEVRQLLEAVNKAKDELGVSPVGDVCNRLVFLDPTVYGKKLDKSIVDDLKQKIATVNARLMCVSLDELNQIKTLAVVAGGKRYKTHAIYYFLKKRHPAIDILCTDSKTAEALLEMA